MQLRSKRKTRNVVTRKISVVFVVSGILSFILSVFYDSQAMAFIGLGLTFWGALFFLIRPYRYVQGSLLDSSAFATYLTIDRIIADLKYEGGGYYIPPLSQGTRSPSYLRGLKDTVVFVSADKSNDMPSIEELSEGKFLTEKPKGLLVTPPGTGLLTEIEKQFPVDFTNMQLEELCELLPRLVVENLNLGKSMELKLEENEAYLEVVDSLFKNLYSAENNLRSVSLLGCPIVSAVACALAKVSGKIVTIEKHKLSPNGLTIEVWYRIVQG